ncbi:ABC-F family ATP-binding cassette domain-containing protein, partial [Streptomyces mirabilis]|uniref:ABC-F family ATP-binding cassette domain-containing protein n=1 Tax=Streptomyces mirabilis TaxID=68239 RepID=UPI00364D135E
MISASGIELRAGARILIESATFRITKGDRIGLVGRNGAGKTTLTKVLAGEGIPASGTVARSGEVGYLPQDPRTGDLDVLATDRILSARGLDTLIRKMRENEQRIANGSGATREKAMRQYERQETEFLTKGGYSAEAEAATIAAALNLPDRVLGQPLHTLSGGQRRRVELARILFSDADTLLLDEPTNHLDADSIVWLRDYLKTYRGGFIVISHDVDLVETVVNKVFYLDANRAQIDVYNMGWKLYQQQREADEKRRKRERQNAEKKAAALNSQADKMRAKATKTVAAQNMAKRADKLLAGLEAVRVSDKVAKLRFPEPAPCGKTPLMAEGLSKSYGSLEIFTDVDLAIDKGSRVVILGLNGAGKTTLLKRGGGGAQPRTREGIYGPRREHGGVAPGHTNRPPP